MNRLEKLKLEKWMKFSEGLKYFENASFESVYSNGFDAASAEYEKIIAKLELKLDFTKHYLNPVDTSFRQMIETFRSLSAEQKDSLIDLAGALLKVQESKNDK